MAVNHPNLHEFKRLAKPGALVPVYREIVSDLETPVSAYLKISRNRNRAFLLESVEKADKIGRYSFLGADPSIVFRARGNQVTIIRPDATQSFESSDPLGELKKLMQAYHPQKVKGLPDFHGGAVGYMSYDEVRFFEKLPDNNRDLLKLPDLYFYITDTLLIFDHVRNRLAIVSNAHVAGDAEAAYHEAVEKIDALEARLREPLVVSEDRVLGTPDETIRSNFTREEYCGIVEKAKEYIRAGDVFQVVLSQRFERNVYTSPVTLYRALRCVNPSPYMILMQFPEFALVGSSPEVMTQVKGRKATVRPIAGTKPRGKTPEEDAALEVELKHDEKELAEHIMLVDLGRNDLGRVSRIGSVRPSPNQLMVIERYSHVMHIVSQVEGELRPDADAFDALRATFPMGTVSGAPKIRAMEIIDELETLRRGPYSGGCGYIGFNGDMDTCILIRTMVVKDGVAHLQAGAGIVYDSDPEREYQESRNKAEAMFEAVKFAERGLES